MPSRSCASTSGGRGADAFQFLGGEVLAVEFPNGQRRSLNGTWREDGGDAGAVREPGIQQRLFFADFISEDAGDIADGHLQAAFGERRLKRHGLDQAAALDKNLIGAVHHDFGNRGIHDEVLDGPEKRKNQIEAHHISPCESCSK